MSDQLQRLWSPHRMSYITAEPRPAEERDGEAQGDRSDLQCRHTPILGLGGDPQQGPCSARGCDAGRPRRAPRMSDSAPGGPDI